MIWPGVPPSWLLPWIIWRFRGTGERPTGTPKTIPQWAWGFLRWAAWRRDGADPAERPPGLPVRIPQWAWGELKLLNQAVPVKPPPPPPPPPPPAVVNSWTLPLPFVFMAWGPRNDWQTIPSFEAIVKKHRDAGIRTVALQIGHSSPWHADVLRSFGMSVCMWGVASMEDQAALDSHQADGYMPQVEGPFERDPAIDALRAGVGRGLSLSIVTTFSGLEEGQFDWFKREGCTHAFVETYAQTGGNRGDVPLMLRQAGIYDIPHRNAVPAIYWDPTHGDFRLPDYDLSGQGEQIGVWSAEFFEPEDFADLAAL